MTNRAERRTNTAKKKKQSIKLWGHALYADHMTKCSCAACGNARKYAKGQWKLTMQERKADNY